MKDSVKKIRDFYNQKPGASIMQREFGFFCLDKWKEQGYINDTTNLGELFGYEDTGTYNFGELGWCEAPFFPAFETKVLETDDEYELVQDYAGRHVKFFKGRRNGFMPTYVDHPVKDIATWENDVKWRLNPDTPERFANLKQRMIHAQKCAQEEYIIVQSIIGGYMYLRSLIGPENLLFAFYDDPKLIHECMKIWLEVSDKVCALHQEYVTFDEVFLAEDICYNCSCLISDDMMREFLIPYYQQLISNIKSRQLDKNRKLHVQVDTDGNALAVIDVYRETIGMDYMSPFEAASGCDVVEVRKKYPDLLIRGGIDKRILAAGKDAIDREVERIMPFMKAWGGYIPTCDHGVPEEVFFEDYMHYRKRMLEYK